MDENMFEIMDDEQSFVGGIINLVLEDNEEEVEVGALILADFFVGDLRYIAVLPLKDEEDEEEDDDDEGDVYLYRFSLSEEGDPILDNIESDEEYEAVADVFDTELAQLEAEEE